MDNFLNGIFLELKKIMEAEIDPMFDAGGKLDSLTKISTFILNNTGY